MDRFVGGDEDVECEVMVVIIEKEFFVDKVECDGGVEGGNKVGDEEVEEEDEDEDDGKLISFGKVVMVDFEVLMVKLLICCSLESIGFWFLFFLIVFVFFSMYV